MELWSRDLLLGVTMDDDVIVAAVVFAALASGEIIACCCRLRIIVEMFLDCLWIKDASNDVSHSSKRPLCTIGLRVSQWNASNRHVLAYVSVITHPPGL